MKQLVYILKLYSYTSFFNNLCMSTKVKVKVQFSQYGIIEAEARTTRMS